MTRTELITTLRDLVAHGRLTENEAILILLDMDEWGDRDRHVA